jgi:Fe-S-cluster containining protein
MSGVNQQTQEEEAMTKYAAELIGTFWLVLGGCGSAVLAAAFPNVGIGLLGVSFAFGWPCWRFRPIATGLGLTLIHLISIPVTNTSVNPARSTGVALFAGGWAVQQLWLFWIAPIVGSLLGRPPTASWAALATNGRNRRQRTKTRGARRRSHASARVGRSCPARLIVGVHVRTARTGCLGSPVSDRNQGMTEQSTDARQDEHLRRQVAEGLLYAHARLSENTKAAVEVGAFLYALIELFCEKGLISIEELDGRVNEVRTRLEKKNTDRGVGVLIQEEPAIDKYAFEGEARIDCENRIHLCRASCCRLPFALSRQDIREGVIHWDLGQPYIIEQTPEGYCTHLEHPSCRCTVREHRPVPCRAYDCRKDQTIWLDFDNRVINPEILRADWPRAVKDAEPSRKGV